MVVQPSDLGGVAPSSRSRAVPTLVPSPPTPTPSILSLFPCLLRPRSSAGASSPPEVSAHSSPSPPWLVIRDRSRPLPLVAKLARTLPRCSRNLQELLQGPARRPDHPRRDLHPAQDRGRRLTLSRERFRVHQEQRARRGRQALRILCRVLSGSGELPDGLRLESEMLIARSCSQNIDVGAYIGYWKAHLILLLTW